MSTDEGSEYGAKLRTVMDELYAPLDETADSIAELDGRVTRLEQSVREILIQLQDLRHS